MPLSPTTAYRDYADFLRQHFDGKVQKLAVSAISSCPNRDGTKGTGGCVYCDNRAFSPGYCGDGTASVSDQLQRGKQFFAGKYPQMRYLAYFQTYTSTYAPLPRLRELYEQALGVDGVAGLVIATRPDCMPDDLLQYLGRLAQSTFVMVEYGVESAHDTTLSLIRRGHTWADAAAAIRRTASAGVHVGAHVILGLPGESKADIMATATALSATAVEVVKLHQLQVIGGTELERMWRAGEARTLQWTAAEYADVCVDFLERLRPDIAVERFVSQSPAGMVVSPRWGLKSHEFARLLSSRLRERHASQGRLYRQ